MIDFPNSHPRPGDQRGFLHKKLLGFGKRLAFGLGGPKGVLQVGSQLPGVFGQASRALAARTAPTLAFPALTAGLPALTPPPRALTPPRTATARVSPISIGQRQLGTEVKFSSEVPNVRIPGFLPCILPFRIDPRTGQCRLFVGEQTGRDDTPMGDAIMGQYGAGLIPGSQVIDRAVCLKGMQLGNDGVCYNKSQITNKQRMWPAGRKPLLSGGDMRAINIAARAGKRLEGTTKRLQKLGMMRKPARARASSRPTQHERLIEAHVTN